jgi:crossover junction endodeoxyribonuclease RusA
MEIKFPIEFLVRGTPVSLQSENPRAKERWKARVKDASSLALPTPHFVSSDRIAITIYYFPDEPMQGDIDNIVKLIIDGMCRHVFVDDRQVERIVVQKFEPGNIFSFTTPTSAIVQALDGDKPNLYVRISSDPFEELR